MSMQQAGWVERLRDLDACALSDALDSLGLPGATLRLRPLWNCPPIVGPAITVQIGPKGDTQPSVHLNTPAIEESNPGDVIVVANGGREDVSCWGDILSSAAKVKRVSGVVIDGACRDIDASAEVGFPVYGLAVVPVSARNRIVQVGMNDPVTMAGVTVRSGDLVLADGSGTVFVPADRAEEVISAAERLVAKQRAMVAAVRGGRSVVEVMHDREFDSVLVKGHAA
jgi:4-hydroxy-4-methyl-2-oxoglutarate aldolase